MLMEGWRRDVSRSCATEFAMRSSSPSSKGCAEIKPALIGRRDSAERLRAAYARCRACSGIDPSPWGKNSVSATSRSGPSSATFQSALPNLTGGAIIRILRRLAPAWRSAHRSPAPFQFRKRFRTKSYSKDAGADFSPGQRCRGYRRRPLASESDHHHLARRAPLPDAVVSPPKIGGVDGAKHFCERRPDLAVVDHLRKS